MDTVQFDPKISTDLQVNWRRQNPGAGADMFTDLLADQMKRRADADQQELDVRRRDLANSPRQTSDPVSGRPLRVVVSHPKTLRGEATEVDESADRRLSNGSTDRQDCAPDDSGAKAIGDPAAPDETAAGVKDKTTDANKAEAAAAGDQPAQATDSTPQTPDPVATAVVAVQPTDQKAAGCAQEIAGGALSLPIPGLLDGQPVAPATDQATGAKNAAAGGTAAANAAPAQLGIEAAAAADLAAVLTMLGTDGEKAANGAGSPAPGQQALAAAITPANENQPLLQMPQAPAPVADPAAIQPQAARPMVETRVRASAASTHINTDLSDPAPSQSGSQQPAQSYAAAPTQPAGSSDSGGDGNGFDQSFSADGSAPGWALHLAQGAAGKRADFVAQLKQHLQNLPMQEQVAVHIQRALREGAGKVSIQLSPEELGRIHVKLEIDEDKHVTAAVTVERPSTLELLQRDIKGLERALHDAGLSMEGGDLSFSLGQNGDQDFAQDLNQSGAAATGAAVTDIRSEDGQPDSRAAQVTNTAAGVVNLQV